jgi:hypothetical protein
MNHRGLKRTAILAATAGLAATGIGLAAGPASASTTNIDQWSPASGCLSSPYLYCLWYRSGKGTGGYGWGGSATSPYNIPSNATFTIPGSCPESYCGAGAAVRNDAASMSNGTYNCNVTVWSADNHGGSADWLAPTWGGNLTAGVSNHDESIDANNCT